MEEKRRQNRRGKAKKCWKDARSLQFLMPIIILSGIYSGVFTPTESAVIGAALFNYCSGICVSSVDLEAFLVRL